MTSIDHELIKTVSNRIFESDTIGIIEKQII